MYLQRNSKRVLIIEDELDLALLLKTYLLGAGCQVHLAHSLHAALHLIERTNPDVIVVDPELYRTDPAMTEKLKAAFPTEKIIPVGKDMLSRLSAVL